MDLEVLRQTIAKGESESLELKKSTGDLKGGMKTICAMLNGTGGRVVYGVTPAGKIVGQDITDPTLREVAQEIRRLEPPAPIEQARVPVGSGKEILILQTTTAPDVPYTYDGRPYRRIGPTTSQMPQPEYQQQLLARSHALYRWENQVAERCSLSDLDSEEIDRTVEAAIHCGRLESRASSSSDALNRLQLTGEGQLLRAAVVLFGRKFMPYYPQCTVRLARFKGIDKSEFLDHRQLHGHAFQILDESMHFILRNIPIAGRFEPGKLERQDVPLYPPLALREALVNAICHRDYTIAGGAIFVAIYDDRLEVASSGLLPPGITLADLKSDHDSRLRNPLIAGVFYRRGLIEQWGRGTQKIVDWCVAAGQPEPEFEERAGDLVVRFRPQPTTRRCGSATTSRPAAANPRDSRGWSGTKPAGTSRSVAGCSSPAYAPG